MRFNPPPNWPPAPPGWTPPPGWQPDASWPPPPPGWHLWVRDVPRRKAGLIIGAISATLLVAIGVLVAVVATRRPPDITATPTTTAAASETLTDREQIEAVVERFQMAWNDIDFAAFAPIVCEKMRNADEFNQDDFLEARDVREDMDVSVVAVEVDGDSATASVMQVGEDPNDIGFVREDGEWKWCEI